jgi:hypothetical protein
MAIFLIHYDMYSKPDVEYPTLIPKLTKLGARRLTASCWAVKTDVPIADIRDELEICCATGDRMLVAQISDWRTVNTMITIDSIAEEEIG